MYKRFTDRARRVMQLAEREAKRLNHEYIGTEHILLGLLAERHAVAGKVLHNLGVNLEQARLQVGTPLPEGRKHGDLPLSPWAQQTILYSREECANLSHSDVGTEHLILGPTRQSDGGAKDELSSSDISDLLVACNWMREESQFSGA